MANLIEFSNIVQEFDNNIVLKGVNLQIEENEFVTLLGPSGCGKTTLINLLMRFYDQNRGSIEIDGINTLSIDRNSLRKMYGMVLQETWIFKGSIKENIAYVGASDTTNAKKLDCQIRLFKSWGFEVLENRLKNCQISMGLKQQAIFHPLKYLKGLLAQCKHIDIYEHSLVTGSMHQDGLVCLEVNGFKVQARQVVWMTRYPPNLQHGYFFRIIQEKEHVIFQEGQSNGNSILDLSTNYSKRYLDEQHILMIKRIDDLNQVYWYAQDGKPLRKIPYIGKMNGQEYVAYAYNKWGMTLSHVASKLIYDLIINDESKYASLYQPSYGNYLKSGADMLKLVKNNYHGMIKNRLVSSKKLKLKKQQGKVIRHQGRLLAVYKDAQERIFYFSPYCPHLKCVVQYNEIDNTWNCPCHGSIFDCHGKLVSGPATKDLKQY